MASAAEQARVARAGLALSLHGAAAAQVLDAAQAEHGAGVSAADEALLHAVPARLARAEDAVRANAALLGAAAALSGAGGGGGGADDEALAAALRDLPAVAAALARLAADWGVSGAPFRAALYAPVVAAAADAAAGRAAPLRALVPGAGLGRLAWELAAAGAAVQGAEADFVLLFLANYVLNGGAPDAAGAPARETFFPHALRVADVAVGALEPEEFPDVDPASLRADASLSMRAGGFLALYDAPEEWDCVATCAFLETAHSAVAVVRRIGKILKRGGVWINNGGLDFRYADDLDEPSVELTEEELFDLIPKMGMRVTRSEKRRVRKLDAEDALVREEYDSLFFVAVRE